MCVQYSIMEIFCLDLILVSMSINENKIHKKEPALQYIPVVWIIFGNMNRESDIQ